MELQIGQRLVGEGHPCYVIAEAGVNHNGSLELARKLIDVAAAAGADAVKFQMRDLATLYTPEVLDTFTGADLGVQYVFPMIQESQLTQDEFGDLAAYCQEKGLEFLCTPWDIASVDILDAIGVAAFKVASADMTNVPLIEHIAAKGKPMVVSTGMSSLEEIRATVAQLKSINASFVLLHTSSAYPAPFKDLNLRFMQRMREEFDCLIGYSGHELGIAVSAAAVALGASVLERHVTLDRTMRGPDHAISLEPGGLTKLVRDIRNIETALGKPSRWMSRGEFLNRETLGKSLVAAVPIAQGTTLERHHMTVRSPGQGLSPQRIADLVGRAAGRNMAQGDMFTLADLGDTVLAKRTFTSANRWGLVVRFHDLVQIVGEAKPPLIEFHFSSNDIGSAVEVPTFPDTELVVHVPELWGDQLLDLCSSDERQRRQSVAFLGRAFDVSRRLRPSFGATPERVKTVVHVGGMSFGNFIESAPLYDRLARSLKELDQDGIELLLENVPPFPWYKGGQWYSNAFVRSEEIREFCETYGYGLCYDTSHAQLTCNHLEMDQVEFLRPLLPLVRHVHVSDGGGLDLEGLQIDEGEIGFAALSPLLLGTGAGFVPEIWMGHRDDGEGFWLALNRLERYGW